MNITTRSAAGARQPRTRGDAATAAERAVVVGGGFIGMEAAASLRRLGLEVTVVHRDQPQRTRWSANSSGNPSG